jgi:surface polysaccharide O-acyltransferase-like enzyme
MTKKLLGVELCRGLSIYAVILDHAGDETWGIPVFQDAIVLRSMLHFAVPFFLATAFYFMTENLVEISSVFWRTKMRRILFPYALWSCIFLVSRIIIFTLTQKSARLKELLEDPLSIIFFGGASYHLYFLPLLMAGIVLIPLKDIPKKINANTSDLVLFASISIILYHLVESSGNAFQLGENIAFQNFLNNLHINPMQYPILRLFLVELSWILRCLPYFFVALILNKNHQKTKLFEQRKFSIFLMFLFLCLNSFGIFIPRDLKELVLAYLLLLFGISFSGYFSLNSKISQLTKSIGACSFGIYLIHPFVINLVKILLNKSSPEIMTSVSAYSILILSTFSLIASWMLVSFLARIDILKYLFGIFSDSKTSFP